MVVQSGELKKQVKGFTALARLYLETGQITKAHEYYVNVSGYSLKKIPTHSNSEICIATECMQESNSIKKIMGCC